MRVMLVILLFLVSGALPVHGGAWFKYLGVDDAVLETHVIWIYIGPVSRQEIPAGGDGEFLAGWHRLELDSFELRVSEPLSWKPFERRDSKTVGKLCWSDDHHVYARWLTGATAILVIDSRDFVNIDQRNAVLVRGRELADHRGDGAVTILRTPNELKSVRERSEIKDNTLRFLTLRRWITLGTVTVADEPLEIWRDEPGIRDELWIGNRLPIGWGMMIFGQLGL